jgi:hypothetical protein
MAIGLGVAIVVGVLMACLSTPHLEREAIHVAGDAGRPAVSEKARQLGQRISTGVGGAMGAALFAVPIGAVFGALGLRRRG